VKKEASEEARGKGRKRRVKRQEAREEKEKIGQST